MKSFAIYNVEVFGKFSNNSAQVIQETFFLLLHVFSCFLLCVKYFLSSNVLPQTARSCNWFSSYQSVVKSLCLFKEFSPDALLTRARGLLQRLSYLDDFYSLGQTESWALEKLKEHIPLLCDWAKKFVVPFPQPDLGAMDFKTPEFPHQTEQPSVCVSALKDIEENIWSPRYGLKGWYYLLLLPRFLILFLHLLHSFSLCFSLCIFTFLNSLE